VEPVGETSKKEEMMEYKTREALEELKPFYRQRIRELEAKLEGMVPRADYEEEVKAKEAHRDGMAVLDKELTDVRAELEAQNLDLRVEIDKLKEQLLKWEERRRKEVFG